MFLSPSRHVEGSSKHQFQQEAKCSALQVGVKKKGLGKVVFRKPTDVFNHLLHFCGIICKVGEEWDLSEANTINLKCHQPRVHELCNSLWLFLFCFCVCGGGFRADFKERTHRHGGARGGSDLLS